MSTLIRHVTRACGAGLSAFALMAALPAGAQTLRLGSLPGVRPVSSGTATIGAAGTTASGTYVFTAGTGPTTVTFRGVEVYDASSLTFNSGATITGALFNQNTGTATINGGSIQQILGYDQSVTNIYGGTVFNPMAVGSTIGGVPGGGTINIYGGNFTYIATQDTGVMNIFGTGLTETLLETSSPFSTYSVTGTLQDGTAFNVLYGNNNGTLLFNGLPAVPIAPVPEVSTILSLGLLLALGGLDVVTRKKKSNAFV